MINTSIPLQLEFTLSYADPIVHIYKRMPCTSPCLPVPHSPQCFCDSLFLWYFYICRIFVGKFCPCFRFWPSRSYSYFRSQFVYDKGEHGVHMEKRLLGPHFSPSMFYLSRRSQKYLHSDIPCQSAHRAYTHIYILFFGITHTTECILPCTIASICVDFFFFSAWWLATLGPESVTYLSQYFSSTKNST